MYDHIQKQDKEVFDAVMGEEKREEHGLELIPSENYVSKAVREAMGSVFLTSTQKGIPASAITADKNIQMSLSS